ncbi:TPA: 8-oxo-dGTP diphosphatase MutT [Candidatus Acetothermia bacterium]|nr:8-oxo-dGTP diphosphatase MutT [Candidatus Acetothermia bacterium]
MRTVVAAFLVQGGRVLLSRRRPGDVRGGLWEFPGGKVEPGEPPEEALARELSEELGIRVEVGEELSIATHAYPDCKIRLHLFRCRILSGEPQPLGCAEVRWADLAELKGLPLAPADEKLLGRLREAGKLPGGDTRWT